jgi:glucosamine 6-phosphate synthetase-like amidotransferase/phosphosugar isomerase protein
MVMFGIKNGLNARKFMVASKADMTKSDSHGLGYAAIDGQGNMFSERFLNVEKAFVKPLTEVAKYQGVLKEQVPTQLEPTEYSTTGVVNFEDVKSIIYHTRFATCARTFENVHPFIIGNTALIHNGIINNSHTLTNVISTCDSETILNEYLKNDVQNNQAKIQETTDALQGYWGVAVLSKQSDGRSILDVFKNNAPLFLAQVEELGGMVICTSDDIIKNTCDKLNWKKPRCFPLYDNKLLRVDAITGEPISVTDITRTISTNWTTSSRSRRLSSSRNRWEENHSQSYNWLYNNEEASDSKYSDVKKTKVDILEINKIASTLNEYFLKLSSDEQNVLNSLDYETKMQLLYDAYMSDSQPYSIQY